MRRRQHVSVAAESSDRAEPDPEGDLINLMNGSLP